MIYGLLALWICVFILDFIPLKIRRIIPISVFMLNLSLSYIQPDFILHKWPYGIEFSTGFTNTYLFYIYLASTLISTYTIHTKPNLATASLTCLLGAMQILSTLDWFNVYVGFEILLIGMMLFGVKTKWSKRYAYLEIQIIGTTIVLLGIISFYVTNNHLGIKTDLLKTESAWSPAAALLIIGLAMKSGLWPFHGFLRMYESMNFEMYIIATTVLSKISIYCLSFFAKTSYLYQLLYVLSILKSIHLAVKAKKLMSLQTASLLNSNAIFMILIESGNLYIQNIYIIYAIILQILFSFSRFRVLSIILGNFPLISIGFLIKLMLLKTTTKPYISILLILSSLVFNIKTLDIIIRLFLRFKSRHIIAKLKE